MGNKKIKFGVMGGLRGRFLMRCQNMFADQLELISICETDLNVIEAIKGENILNDNTKFYDDFDSFLKSGVEAIFLANFFHEHTDYAIKAMEAGIAVLCETTAGPSLGDCVRLVEAQERTNGKYMLAANCLYLKAVQGMKKTLSENKFGPVIYADAEYVSAPNNPHYVTSGTTNIDPNNLHWRNTLPGCYYNMHDLGPLLYMTNSTPKKVVAKATSVPKDVPSLKKAERNYVLVETDTGAVFNYSGSCGAGAGGKWYRVACRYGTVESVRYDTSKFMECAAHQKPVTISPDLAETIELSEKDKENFLNKGESTDNLHGGIDALLIVHFLKYVRGEEEPFFDIYRSVDLSVTAIMAWYSALLGSVELEIPDLRNPADRDKVRNDFRSPFAKTVNDVTLPFNVGEKFELNL